MSSAKSARSRWQHAADTLNTLGWFLPAYIQGQAVFGLVQRIEASPDARRPAVLADGVCDLYAPRALAVMLLHRYRTTPFVRDFEPVISECIEASCYGFLRVATTSLAPVIEGVTRAIARDQGIAESAGGASKLIRDVVEDLGSRAVDAAPSSVAGEVSLLVASYKRFFNERFWEKTQRRPTGETLNRHALLHGISVGEEYGTRYNFSRLISVLDLFCFLIAFGHPTGERLSILAPDETNESKALANYFGFCAVGRLAAIGRLPVRL